MPKAKLWIINYRILEMKAVNEPAIGATGQKMKISFTKKKTNKIKQKDKKKKKKKNFRRRESNPGRST